ncbi:MAG TPA: chromosomal replication initiator protein DnaA [Candidatus Scatomorpha pullistercoris]|uniref:Chromosomal replication initiator protein DnaA n=1 Tax=Candidatus Scatomorpha pullistercoris TaxID=2840929 RepID=A0A9D1G533_9FIRM|nr:chromosomal replication initiator protein DnaA [Candidatus Scatomorpha pullistercoris]
MDTLKTVWQNVLDAIAKQITPTAFNTWFADCEPYRLEEETIVILTTSELKMKVLNDKFGDIIHKALIEVFSSDLNLFIMTVDDAKMQESRHFAADTPPEMDAYTFENFIVGPSNEFANAASIAVAKNPGKVYNPLFIYGNSGLGKTHLLMAICNVIHENNMELPIAYVCGDEFTNRVISAIRNGTMDEVRNEYRNVGLFLMDDIQYIAGKRSTQEEFFSIFNAIYRAGGQIVITADRPPIDMSILDDRLRTRLEGGLMADVQPPDIETRVAIIRSKANQLGMQLTPEVENYIAENITSNVRQLEGVVKRLTAYREILNDNISISSVKRAIKDVIRVGTYIPTPEVIIEETARYFSITTADIKGQRRSKNVAKARQVSMYLIRSLTNLSLVDIGSQYEGRNHSTVLNSIRKIEELLKTDQETADSVRDISSNINSRS